MFASPFSRRSFVALAFFFFVCSPASASVTQYSSRLWQMDDGLPQNSVQALAQTADGYLWIGTQNGLARFDGVRFTIFDSRNVPALKNSSITALLATREGKLWIGTLGGLVEWENGQFTNRTLAADVAGNSIKTIFESRDGRLWIGTLDGLVQFERGRVVRYSTAEGLNDKVVRTIGETENELLIGTSAGLSRWKDGVFTPYPVPYVRTVRTIVRDKEGNVWLGTAQGLVRIQGEQITRWTSEEGLADSNVNALHHDSRGNLWIGSVGNLSHLTDGKFLTEKDDEENPFDQINTIFEDREGTIWIGAKDGLHQLRPKRFITYTRQQGLSHNNVMSVREDSKGVMWAGTWGGGLNYLKEGKIHRYTATDKATTNMLASDLILGLYEDPRGFIWVGADYDGGVFRFKAGEFDFFSKFHALKSPPSIRVIAEEQKRQFWLGTGGGVVVLSSSNYVTMTKADGLAGDSVRVILKDHVTNMWVGTSDGLSFWNNGKLRNFTTSDGLPHNTVLALFEDKEKNLWIGTAGGLCKMKSAVSESSKEKENGRKEGKERDAFTFHVSRFTSKEGLFSDEIFEILEDNSGYLWMSSLKGVFRVSKKELDELDAGKIKVVKCFSYGTSDGMASPQCNGVAKPAAWKSKDGRLWFATIKGVAVVDPNAEEIVNELPPPVVVEEVIAGKRRIQKTGDRRQEAGSESSHQPTFSPSHFLVPPGRGELEIHYTALSLRVPEENQFKYRLEGLDQDWVDAGSRRIAYYNNVPPGDYTFRVQGCNHDGIWNEFGANVKFTLQPHFWQTKWFLVLMALAAISAAAGAARYVTWKRMQQQFRQLEQQHAIEKERARIARDIHDDLGARLTEISVLSDFVGSKVEAPEIKTHVGRISKGARETVRNLDALVWAVNPKNDSVDQLALYLGEYVEMFFSATPVRYNLEIPDDLPPAPISSEARHNLFLVVKEALNNVVKHAAASEVSIRLLCKNEKLSLVIEDNGKGFSIEASGESALGNGLANMKKRMADAGGKLLIQSLPKKGTQIQIELSVG